MLLISTSYTSKTFENVGPQADKATENQVMIRYLWEVAAGYQASHPDRPVKPGPERIWAY